VDKLRARMAAGERVTEVHIVGGLHDGSALRLLHEPAVGAQAAAPGISLKAFSAVEIFFFHHLYAMSIEDILRRLQEAGLDSLPGGGAEILLAARAQGHLPEQVRGRRMAGGAPHGAPLGIKSNCTMLFGTVETLAERVDAPLLLRAQQAETAGFMAFIPLPFHPENNALGDRPRPPRPKSCARSPLLA
jgi:aminodeoxyfutalosine synthase